MPNFPDLLWAYAIAMAVPDEKFNLENTQTCVLGHCARDPYFQSKGFGIVECHNILTINNVRVSFIEAGAQLFNISKLESMRLFDCYPQEEEKDGRIHKQEVTSRFRDFFEAHNENF